MPKKSPTLSSAFGEIDPALNDPTSSKRRSLGERMRKSLAKQVEWVAAMPELVEKIAGLLDIELPELFMPVWRASEKISEALQRSEAEPTEKIALGLFDHEIEVALHPEIEVTVELGGVPTKYSLTFDVTATCALTGVELTILNGKIISINAGTCAVKGTLEYDKLELARAPREGALTIPLALAS